MIYGKYSHADFVTFVYIFITQESYHFQGNFSSKFGTFSAPIQIIRNSKTSQGYIFHILQYLATKLGNFTHFRMLFLAVVKDFVHIHWINI